MREAPGPEQGESTLDAGREAAPHRQRGWILLGLLVAGLALRLVALDETPLSFHPARQYRSVVIAHAYHLSDTRPADDPERISAELVARGTGDLEPTILERASATIFRVTGPRLVVPRLMGIVAWLAGGAACWSILGRLRGLTAQVVGTATVLVLPMGVAASRAFQPDALTVALGLVGMALALRAEDTARPRSWIPAVAACAAAVLVKPMIGPVALAWCAAVLGSSRGWAALRRPWPLAGAGAVVAPTVAYYFVRMTQGGASGGWMGGSFVPSLLTDADTYVTLWHSVDRAVPVPILALAVLAVAAARDRARVLLGAAAAGHLAMMTLVNYRAATHDYYHLPVVALAALAVGVGADAVADWLRRSSFAPPVRRGTAALLLAGAALTTLALVTGSGAVEARIGDGSRHVTANRRIGELTQHSRHVLGVTYAYGTDLSYDGGVVVTEYPSPADAGLLRARGSRVPTPAEVIADSGAEWLAVTNMGTYDALPDLQAELRTHHELAAQGQGWVLWRLHPPG